MPRDITITFSDGTKHQYNNTPDSVTPDDIEKRAKKDYPTKKISNISGGKKKPVGDPLSADPISANARPKGSVGSDTPAKTSSSAPSATPPPITKNDELDQVKKNAGVPASGGQFSIKGIRFGMPVSQVEPMLSGLTIGGYGGGYLGWQIEEQDKKIVKLFSFPSPNQVDSLLSAFTANYGKPQQFKQFKSKTVAGQELDDYTATWKIQDAVIEMNRHIKRDGGYFSISSKEHDDRQAEKYKEQDQKAKKDF
jgi:hypothetical protein